MALDDAEFLNRSHEAAEGSEMPLAARLVGLTLTWRPCEGAVVV